MTKSLTKKEEVKPGGLQLSGELSSLLESTGNLIEVRSNLLKPLRIRLMQKSSQQFGITGGEGDFVCDNTGTNYGQNLTVVPLLIKESASLMYTEQNPPRSVRDGKMNADDFTDSMPCCYSVDLVTNKDGIACSQCPFGEYWNEWIDKKPPQCRSSIDMVCIPEGEINPVVLQFRKTSYAAGKELINKVAYAGGAPFMFKYTFNSVDDTNGKHRYKKIDSNQISKEPLTQEDLNKYAPAIENFLKKQKDNQVKYDVTEFDDAETTMKKADLVDNSDVPF